MSQVQCLYCGARIADHLPLCTQCGGPSHFQQRGGAAGYRRRFVRWFVLLCLLCLALAWVLVRVRTGGS